ncbi:MAG: glucose-6-phosphate dehydrogenase [Candidatus Zixiibacteriota bacterium]
MGNEKSEFSSGSGINPFRRNQTGHTNAEPCSIIIFGASGDLTRRKLVPALFNLTADKSITVPFNIIGFARSDKKHSEFRSLMRKALEEFSRVNPERFSGLDKFLMSISYCRGNFDNPEDFKALAGYIREIEAQRGGAPNRLYYLATPPDAFPEIIRNLKKSGLTDESHISEGWQRIVIEKPYGKDLKSAWMLTGAVHSVFNEEQVYRIDHYLGKETVQNILAFRLGNGIFEPLWNRRYIDHVQITVAETLGVEGRAGYFDTSGIMRDMIQSHILQLFSLIAMEPPVSFAPQYIRDEKVKLLRSVHPINLDNVQRQVVRGQYQKGSVGGKSVVGYLEEPGVSESSRTETYLAMRLEIDNWRWSGVPFYIRVGKRLARKITEVDIVFKAPPHQIFKQAGIEHLQPNVLGIKIQPEEGISLCIGSKRPGQSYEINPVSMEFNYATSFGIPSPEAYERLLLDTILGDSTLFAREDGVDLSWGLLDPVLKAWENDPSMHLAYYEAGSWGPHQTDILLSRDGRGWRKL